MLRMRIIRSGIVGVGLVAGLWWATAWAGASPLTVAPAAAPSVVVYKTPTCGCCTKWIEHLKQAGFAVTAHDTANVAPIRSRHGVPQALQSCHTALVGGYVVEGHVPADVIQRLLRERPKVAGIAVPGMPAGSPGMEGLGGPARQPYQVLAFRAEGGWTVYERR
jgi:hypothetical protein